MAEGLPACQNPLSNPRWKLIKERFYENKKEKTLSTKKESKVQLKEKKKENTLTTKKKVRKQDLDHAIDQENSKF